MNWLKTSVLTAAFTIAALGSPSAAMAGSPTTTAATAATAAANAARQRRVTAFVESLGNPAKSMKDVQDVFEKMNPGDMAGFDQRDLPHLEKARKDFFKSGQKTEAFADAGHAIAEKAHAATIRYVTLKTIATISDSTKTAQDIQSALNGYSIDINIKGKTVSFGSGAADFIPEIRKEILGKHRRQLTQDETLSVIKSATEKQSNFMLTMVGSIALVGAGVVAGVKYARRDKGY